jgi:predicted metal-binding protein
VENTVLKPSLNKGGQKMLKIKTCNHTAAGAKIPIEIRVKRVSRADMLKYQIADSEVRNTWCTGGGCSCAKYGCRPCCPPKVKLFNALKARKHMYLVFVKMVLEDYYTVYPNVRESKSWCYFGMDGTHKMTRNIQNKIAESFEGQAFRVGGCLGCQYPKTGKCKRYAPALEATSLLPPL